MNSSQIILERWVARTMESYPAQTLPFLAGEKDRFRNPVGYTLQENLATLLRELVGPMDREAMAPALDAIVRMRAVQDFTASDAVRFVFELRTIVRDISGAGAELLEHRIDDLALMAFDRYMSCRDQIAGLRAKERQLRAQCSAP